MASLEPYVTKVKPALDSFLRAPQAKKLRILQRELTAFSWMHMNIYNVQILCPLVLKLEELSGQKQEIRIGIMNCISHVISKIYLKEEKGLRTILVIVLRQLREYNSATTKPKLSEEIKLAAVTCISEAFRRSTTDVLEIFYNRDTVMLLGQILLTLVEFIESEKYKTLVNISIECLMIVFYVHDEADSMDVVLRSQVANNLFIYLPKIVTILYKMSLSDEKLGETLKASAIKALGRILCVTYECTNGTIIKNVYNSDDFRKLCNDTLKSPTEDMLCDDLVFGKNKSTEELEERLKKLQVNGRNTQWFEATSRKLNIVFIKTKVLRSHESARIRLEFAQMCCLLMERCAPNLKCNFIHFLENIVAMSEDSEVNIRRLCQSNLQRLQIITSNEGVFNENSEILFDEHLAKLPRIINRCNDDEQYAELLFLKGFLRNVCETKLLFLFSMPKNLEMFCLCLLSAVDLKVSRDLLNEEYSLRQMSDMDYNECQKFHWRQYKHLNSKRCVQTVQEICAILGGTQVLNRIIYDFFLELLSQENVAMNEIMLIMCWMACVRDANRKCRINLVDNLLKEILNEDRWHLSLHPDHVWRLKVEKPTNWFVDRTPGLYESAIEVRTQDYDSDDENGMDIVSATNNRVSIIDAEYNVLHTCIILDTLGHCAIFLGDIFDKYLFSSLHKILLKVASNNSMVYQAATFALISVQKSLKFTKPLQLIEMHTDYITYHLNKILKRTPESKSAVDILTVVLQFSTRRALPHLDSIFQTIREECTKSYQAGNIIAYLKVFHAFLAHISNWQIASDAEVDAHQMHVDELQDKEDLLTTWLKILEKPSLLYTDSLNIESDETMTSTTDTQNNAANVKNATNGEKNNVEDKKNDEGEAVETEENNEHEEDEQYVKPTLPQHIEMIKYILEQVLKFISSSESIHQILALECLIDGVPLLKDYENELLPLVHLIWQPFIEKFRQKNAIVLNRCFTLLNTLATHAKDFILKRSLDDVIPFLKQFLNEALLHSANKTFEAKTQEYKLQIKLLQEFANLIQCMEIDGRQLNEIFEVISLYLSQDQPEELQDYAVKFFESLRYYNGPLVYLIILKKLHLKDFQKNTSIILQKFQFE